MNASIKVLTVLAPNGIPVTYVEPSERLIEAAEAGIGPFRDCHGWALRTLAVPDTCTHCEVEPYEDYGDEDCARTRHFVTGHLKGPDNELVVTVAYDADTQELDDMRAT